MLEERLTFVKRTEQTRVLHLKTSLKQNRIQVDYRFSHPNYNLLDPLLQFRRGGLSVGIDVPLCEIQKETISNTKAHGILNRPSKTGQ